MDRLGKAKARLSALLGHLGSARDDRETDERDPVTRASIPPAECHPRLAWEETGEINFTPLHPLSFLVRNAQICPERVAIAHGRREYTYAVWCQRVQNLAYALKKYGVERGDRVAVLSPNAPCILDAHFGILAARGVINAINTRLRKEEVSYILEHSGAKILLIDEQCVSSLEASVKDRIRLVVVRDTGRDDDPYEQFLTEGREYSQEAGWRGLEPEADEMAPCAVNYTSGTTGKPKGVLTTLRGSYLAALANVFECQLLPTSRYLWTLPAFHASGWTFPWAVTAAGSTHVCLRGIDYSAIWQKLKKEGITHFNAAPTVCIGIMTHPDAVNIQDPSRPDGVVVTVAGAAPTAAMIAEMEGLNLRVTHVYGLTETYGPVTRCYPEPSWATLPLGERAILSARQGHAFLTSDECRVVERIDGGEDGDQKADVSLRDVPWDGMTSGEIVVRGNICMKGYFKNDDATQKAFLGNWFHTGDIAVRHPNGAIQISDRSKDLIISGGENISTLALESDLMMHPAVLEVACVAKRDAKWGERPRAYVVLRSEARTRYRDASKFERELIDFAKEKMAGYKVPASVVVLDELPKTSTGKTQKNVLREMANKKE